MANSSFSATGSFWWVDWKMRKDAIASAKAPDAEMSHQCDREAEVAASEAVESVPESAPRAKPRSRADWKRLAGFFSRQWRTMRFMAGETFSWSGSGSGGSSLRMAFMVSTLDSPLKARWPEMIS